MRRLFWKFFGVIFLAHLASVAAIGGLVWTMEPRHGPHWDGPRRPPVPDSERGSPPERRPPLQDFGPPPGARAFPTVPFAVGLVASFVFALLLARHLSKPILALREGFDAVGKGNFDVRLGDHMAGRADELGDLGRDFDRTAQQLKLLMHSQRRLLHDVSHEVRSPLARIQLALDLARQQPDKSEASLVRIEREAARINRLMEELLTLSRLEAGSIGRLDECVDVAELVGGIVNDARFEAEPKQCIVALTVQGEAVVTGSAELLHRAIENVVRNAVRYTFDATTVSVTVGRQGERVVVDVADDGPGIPDAALGAIFEPFVRFREDRGHDGYGLGLAITRQVVDAHGGQLQAVNRPSGGLSITLCLPAASPAQISAASNPS